MNDLLIIPLPDSLVSFLSNYGGYLAMLIVVLFGLYFVLSVIKK